MAEFSEPQASKGKDGASRELLLLWEAVKSFSTHMLMFSRENGLPEGYPEATELIDIELRWREAVCGLPFHGGA